MKTEPVVVVTTRTPSGFRVTARATFQTKPVDDRALPAWLALIDRLLSPQRPA